MGGKSGQRFLLGVPCDPLGLQLGPLGVPWDPLGLQLGPLGVQLAPLGVPWVPLGTPVRISWGSLGLHGRETGISATED